MKRRLRKKKRVGEFQELGCDVKATLRDGLSDEEFIAFFDRWIDAVEARDLGFGGGGSPTDFGGYVVRLGRRSVTEDDRTALSTFLQADAAVVEYEIGELCDAWYGWD